MAKLPKLVRLEVLFQVTDVYSVSEYRRIVARVKSRIKYLSGRTQDGTYKVVRIKELKFLG